MKTVRSSADHPKHDCEEGDVNVNQLASNELYYKEITEACVGSDNARRDKALQSLSYDTGLHQILPRLCSFIAEGVRENVKVLPKPIAILTYLMRMVKSLLENQTLHLDNYMHELIPAVQTCIISRLLCTGGPHHENHCVLKDFASRIMATICKKFNNSTNKLETKVANIFVDALNIDQASLHFYYGAIAGLVELGPEVIKDFLLPHIAALAQKIDQV